MANRYDIIHIDFQASARGANAAIESIRQEADKCNTQITELKKNIAEAPKNGTDKAILEGWQQELRVAERRYNQLSAAQKELVKGMRALDEGVKMFNDGSLSAMNAAFQKTVNNAAKLAQSKLANGTKEWRDMGALMQETEQNYARMQRDTDQLIESLKNGGTVFRKTLDDEIKGLQDLMRILPYMGTEYRKADEQLKFLVKTNDELIIKERQLKGEIVTTDDARRVSFLLTKEGAEAARQRAAAADLEIEKGKKTIETLEQEKKIREENARASAEAAAEYRENQRMYEDEIDRLQREMKAEEERAKSSRNGIEGLRKKAQTAGETADKEIAKQKELDGAYETAQQKVARLREEYEKMQQATASAPAKDPATEAIKTGAEEASKAIKEKTKTVELDTQAVEEAGKATVDHTTEIKKLKGEVESLTETLKLARQERDKLTSSQEKGAAAAKKDIAAMTPEEAQAEYNRRTKEFGTVHISTKGVAKFSDVERSQQFLMKLFKDQKGTTISEDGSTFRLTTAGGQADVVKKFQERYGFEGDPKGAMIAIRQLLSGQEGGLIKGGSAPSGRPWELVKDVDATKAYLQTTLELKKMIDGVADSTQKATAATKEGTKAQEDNAEAQKKRAVIEGQIKFLEDQLKKNQDELTRLQKEQNAVENEAVKTEAQAADATEKKSRRKKKSAEATKEETEAIKGASAAIREQQEEVQRLENLLEIENKAIAKNTKEYDRLVSEAKQKPAGQENAYAQERGLEKADRYKEKYIDSHKTAAADLKTQIEQEKATLKEMIKAEKEQAKASKETAEIEEKTVEVKEKKTRSKKRSAEASKEEAEAAQKLKEKKKELKDAEDEEATAKKNAEKQQEKANDAIEKAEEANNKVKTAEDNLTVSLEKKSQELEKNKKSLESLNKANENTIAINEENQKLLEETNGKIREQGEKIRNAELIKAQAKTEGIEKTEQAIRLLTEENRHIDTNSQEWKDNTKEIQALQAALDEMNQKPILQMMTERMERLPELSDSALKETKKFWEAMEAGAEKGSEKLAAAQANMKALVEEEQKRSKKDLTEKAARLGDMGNYSVGEIREGIDAAKKLQETYKLSENEVANLSKLIVAAETRINKVGVEAERQAQKQRESISLMQEQLSNGSSLTESALKAQVQYWQRLADDPKTAAEAVKQYTANMEQAQKLLDDRKSEDLGIKASRLSDIDKYSIQELQEGIAAAKEARQIYHLTDEELQSMSEMIVKAETRINKVSVEAERQAQKQRESIGLMEEQLRNGSSITESALKAQVQYWQRLADDPKTAAEAVKQYTANMEQAQKLLDDHQKADYQNKVRIVQTGTLENYSEAEIQESIKAAKELQANMASGSRDAKDLAESIAKAEAHIKKYGVETARAAQRQEESNAVMRKQLSLMSEDFIQRQITPSESALKAQQQYWQKLIEDPKNAGKSLQEYRDRLAEVEALQEKMVEVKGQTALQWFQNGSYQYASANNTKRLADDLKTWRDTLGANDFRLEEIDSYLQKVGASAKKAAADVMSLDEALKIAEGAGKDGFLASPEQIQAATKAINERRDAVIKLIQDNKRLGASTNTEEAELEDLTKKLRDLKFEQDNFNMSQAKMQSLMETPTNAVNLEELRAAIKRADGELKRMEGSLGLNSDKYKEFAEQVRNAKNNLKEMEGQAKASATAWEKAWNRLKTYVVMYMGFNAVWGKIQGTFGDILELSDKMGEVQKTTNLTADSVGSLSRKLADLDVRTPLTELMAISASAGQLGLKTEEDIMGFTEAANKMMIALPEMGKEAATEMMRVAIATGEVKKIEKQLREGIVEGSSATAVAMEKIASTIDRLRASSASTAPEITDFVKRVGAVGAQSGISIDQVAALGSTISSLGMRVEMSATALSRMIPAIKNNAFAVANAIGVSPEALRSLFEAGRGMEAILMIFQHLKDQNKNADSIEKLLGIGGIQDVMKQLNQQGARAGIVFAGLSQNVDELRKQLVTANEAYEENVAIQKEFDRMNDTSAAKWERFKNRLQEMFVGNTNQKLFGGIISGLDEILKLISDTGPISAAIKTLTLSFIALKIGVGDGLKAMALWFANLSTNLAKAGASLKAFGTANWVGALVTALSYLAIVIYDWVDSMDVAANEMAKLDEKIVEETSKVNGLFRSVAKTNAELENARNKLEEVAKAGGDAAEAENALKKANTEHAATIREINSKYGAYLGYMISETSSAQQLAKARELINAKLRETITLKQQEAALGSVEQEYGGKVNKKGVSMEKLINNLFGKNYDAAARVSVAINEAAQTYAKDSEKFETEVRKIFSNNFKYVDRNGRIAKQFSDDVIKERLTEKVVGEAKDLREAVDEYIKQEDAVNARFEARTRNNRKVTRTAVAKDLNAILADWRDLVGQYRKAEGEEKEKLAAEVYKQQRAYANALANNAEYLDGDKRKAVYEKNIANMKTYEKGLRAVAGEAIRTIDAMERAESKVTGTDYTNDGDSANNPWGGSHEAASTDWKNMNANQLVERRKQMNEFVKAIQTDSDVQSVLKEDTALKAAIEKGMSSDMRTVIEWYNTERLKIQDELHARHLTNTGDWQDPKKQKARQKQFTDEMKAMLEELDAYYTERNQKIQDARNKDEITEGEAWRRTIKSETEWYNRRAELQKLYANKGSEVTTEEQQAIFNIIAEKTGDTAGFIKRSVENTVKFAQEVRKKDQKGEVEYRKWMADLMLGVEKDYLKSAKSIGKQVKFIEDTLAKERPYDSITKNLQENLDKMGILAVRYKRINDELEAQGKEKKYSDAQIKAATYDEMAFYLKNAADAWSIDIDELLRRMVKEGMAVTAEEISKSDMLKQAVMGQLRKTFEEVQNAIKKEASQIKKDVDIIWNDDSQGPGGTSMKAAFEKAISQLGMQQDSVSRANSLIGAGFASENVAARLAMKQIEIQMRMQKTQFDMFRVQAAQRIKALTQEAKEHERIADIMAKEGQLDEAKKERLMATNALQDAENVKKALGLTLTQETKEQEKQKTELLKLQEESQARLYKELQEWVSLMTKGLQGVFEAANFYNSSDYNNLAVARAGGSFNKTTTTTVTNSSSSTTKNTSTSKHTSTGASQTTSSKKTEQGSTAAKESQSKSSTSKNSASNTDTHTTTSTTGTKTSTSTREKQVDYYIIENAGTKDAVAVPVSMTEEEYYEKKIELDRDNAIKDAWKSLLDDLNMKISETITDQINAMFQDAAINANTDASNLNTEALKLNTEYEQQLTAALKELATTEALKAAREANDFSAAYQEGGNGRTLGTGDMGVDENGVPNALKEPEAEGLVIPKAPWQMTEEERAQAQEGMATLWNSYAEYGTAAMQNMSDATAEMPSIVTDPLWTQNEEQMELTLENTANMQSQLAEQEITNANLKADGIIAASNRAKNAVIANEQQMGKTTTDTNNQNAKSTQAAMAKMTLATNMYGLAYQTMSNDNMNATQKFLMFAVQAAGQAAIAMLTTDMATQEGKSKVELPGILGKAASQLGPIAGPIAFGAMMALLGGLMGMAVSAVSKSKSEIAQATGASTSSTAKSISAGKLMTGMLTYGEGNVNEFTDPSSLTPGRSYNVDSADGKTYRAKYMGVGAKTHLTNGPEFHLVGERGREAIIDAHTTRLLQMDDTGIWQAIQTLYNGGSLRHSVMRRKGRGMAAFADGNIDEFETMADGGGLMAGGAGLSSEQMMALQASIDRQSDLLERAMTDGIHAYFDVYGRGGLIDSYDTGKKTVTSHGERY